VMWLVVRRVMLRAVLRQAIEMGGQTTEMRRARYITGVGSKGRGGKEVRGFGLAKFLADRYARQFTEAIGVGLVSLRGLHRRAAACFAGVLAGYALAISVISDAARTHQIGLRSMAIMLPMLAITAAAGSVSYNDITLVQSMFGLPDADRLERDLVPPSELGVAGEDRGPLSTSGCTQRSTILPAGAGELPRGAGREAVRLGGVRFHYRAAAPGQPPAVLDGVDPPRRR